MNKFFAVAAGVAMLGATTSVHAYIYETCSVDDLTFGIGSATPQAADSCFGWDEQYGNPTVELGMVESAFGTEANNDWAYVTKWEGSTASGSYNGVDFTLSANNRGDYWSLSWSDPVGDALPATLDIALTLKAGRGTGGFLFEDMVLPVSPNSGMGDFEVGVLNRRGIERNLSHMTLFIRDGAGDDPGDPGGGQVPLPGTLMLMGAALVGLRWKHRVVPSSQDEQTGS